jgi:hypothetical protein
MTEEKERVLSDKQKAFLDALWDDDVRGHPRKAMTRAGYSNTTKPSQIVRELKDEIIDATKDFIALTAPEAAHAEIDVMRSPAQRGANNKLAAADKLLEKAQIYKQQEIEVSVTENPALLVLPEKDD